MKKIKKLLSPYFNCSTKGVISLFMAVLMTPFLTIAMVLMDTGRYNSAVSILDEAMGISSTSTLAEMDSYLHERWGILGVDQEHSVNDTYKKYLTTNAEILGKSIQLDEVNAEGMYALSENEVLYNQLLEYCKLNAPTELALNFGNISEILDTVKSLESIKAILNIFANGSGAIDATITLTKSADELKILATDLEEKIQDYDDDYGKFESAVSSLIDALNEPEPERSDYTDEDGNLDSAAYEKAKEEWKKAIEDARSSANSARDTYVDTIGKLQESMTAYEDKMSTCEEAFRNIGTKLVATAVSVGDYEKKTSQAKEDLKNLKDNIAAYEKDPQFNSQDSKYADMKAKEQTLSQQVAENDMHYEVLKAEKSSYEVVQDGYKKHFEKYDEAVFKQCIQELSDLKIITKDFAAENYTKDSSVISADTYHSVTIASYVRATDVDVYMAEQKEELMGGSLKTLLDGLVAFFESIFQTSLFFEPELCSTIDMNYYNQYLGGLSGDNSYAGSTIAIINGIGTVISKTEEFKIHFVTLRLLTALKNLKELFESFVQLCKDIIEFVTNIVRNIKELFTAYDRLYYSTYTAFNLPCRTDKKATGISFDGMTGYSLENDSLPSHGSTTDKKIFDDLKDAINSLNAYKNKNGGDLTFSGAELEYILYGSECEVANQMYTFFSIYLLRLLLDIGPVVTNAEVQSLATASTLAYPLVMFLVVLIEPLADTVVLVNGGDVAFIKTSVYLSPSGFPGFLSKLVTVAKLNKEQEEKLKNSVIGAFRVTDDNYELPDGGSSSKVPDYIKGLQDFNYREYCFFMLLLTVSKEQQFTRLKNLIQMETLYHYKTVEKKSYVFDLRKSYTYLDTKATVQVKQMMPSLIDTSLFTATRQQYRGY